MSLAKPETSNCDNSHVNTPTPTFKSSEAVREHATDLDCQISVVVLSKDEQDLAITLDLLQPQCHALNAECIVVDASERRLDAIRESRPWVTWIDYSGPFWRSSTIPHQRNLGCQVAKGKVIAFCDAGGEPATDWLANLTAPLLNGTHSLVCGPVFAKRVGVYTVMNDFADGDVAPSAVSGNMAFLKTVAQEVNGFEERLFYGSDVEFTWRCAGLGHLCYQVRGAGMFMDFGDSSVTLRRSWRYGPPFVLLWNLHPNRRFWMVKNSPDRVLYPLWIALGPLSLLAAINRKLRWAPFAWLGVLGFLLARNRKTPGSYRIVVDHMVGGVSVLNEMARRTSGELPPVILFPDDESPYLQHLSESLKSQGTPVTLWKQPTRSASINILLGPLWTILSAWRGMKIIHIHWTYSFSPSSRAPLGRVARWWFGIFLSAAHAAGIKIVWTVHNLLPHESVFDDDVAARRLLANRADAVIALSPHSARQVSELFGVSKVTVIPHGPLELSPSQIGRDAMRRSMGIEDRTCFTFFGNLRPYKGLEALITVAEQLGPNVVVQICGKGDPNYVVELNAMVERANVAGADVRFEPRWHSEDELADLLAASDVCVFPFVHVDNSGSILLAQACGIPIIIPDLATLQHIENPGVMRYDHTDPVNALKNIMSSTAKKDCAELESLGYAARDWTRMVSWTDIASSTAAVYAEVTRKK